MDYWVYCDAKTGNPVVTPVLKRAHLYTKRPTKHQIMMYGSEMKRDVVARKVRLEFIEEKHDE